MRFCAPFFGLVAISVLPFRAQDPVSAPKPDSASKRAGVASGADAGAKGMVVIDVQESCRVTVDKNVLGELAPGDVKVMPLAPGRHVVTGVSLKNGTLAKVVVDLQARMQEAVLLDFSGAGAQPFRVDPKDGQEYAWIPEGALVMGCSAADRECAADELPSHNVTIQSGFWMGRTEVTRNAFTQFCHATGLPCPAGSGDGDPKLPQDNVAWPDANAYCRWMGGRLPTEAEWEYAARGGEEDVRFPTGNTITHDDANYSGGRGPRGTTYAAPVASYSANRFGLFDMAGNLWEWCADWYSSYEPSPATDPAGPTSGAARVIRGGAWNNLPVRLRVSARSASEPAAQLPTIGFRCVRGQSQ